MGLLDLKNAVVCFFEFTDEPGLTCLSHEFVLALYLIHSWIVANLILWVPSLMTGDL